MYKVTNKMKDVRKFHDSKQGKDMLVEPGKFILTNDPPEVNDVWKVEESKKIKGEV